MERFRLRFDGMELCAYRLVKFCKMGKRCCSLALLTVFASQQQSLMLPVSSVDCNGDELLRPGSREAAGQSSTYLAHCTFHSVIQAGVRVSLTLHETERHQKNGESLHHGSSGYKLLDEKS